VELYVVACAQPDDPGVELYVVACAQPPHLERPVVILVMCVDFLIGLVVAPAADRARLAGQHAE